MYSAAVFCTGMSTYVLLTMAVESIPPAVSPVTIVKWTIYTAYDIAE